MLKWLKENWIVSIVAALALVLGIAKSADVVLPKVQAALQTVSSLVDKVQGLQDRMLELQAMVDKIKSIIDKLPFDEAGNPVVAPGSVQAEAETPEPAEEEQVEQLAPEPIVEQPACPPGTVCPAPAAPQPRPQVQQYVRPRLFNRR